MAIFLVTVPNKRSLWPLIEAILDRTKLVPQTHDAQHVRELSVPAFRDFPFREYFIVERIGTYNHLSSFVAPISERLANFLAGIEQKGFIPFGAQIVALMRPISK